MNNWSEWDNPEFLGSPGAEATEEGRGFDTSNITLNISYLKAINKVILRLQSDIEQTIDKTFKVIKKEKLLEVLRDFYNINLEALREETDTNSQMITTSLRQSGQEIKLKHPVFTDPSNSLMSTTMQDTAVSSDFMRNETFIKDSFFLGTPEQEINRILICEEVPEQYRGFFEGLGDDKPTRRNVFKEQIKEIARKYYHDYTLPGMSHFNTLSSLNLLDDAATDQYLDVFEDTVEQLVSYMGSSRLLNNTDYLQRLSSKIRSQSFYKVEEDSACLVNPLICYLLGR